MTGPLVNLRALFALEWLRAKRGKRGRVALGLAAVVAVAVAIRARGEGGDFEAAADLGFLRILAFALPLLFASGAIADEVSSRRFVYLRSRPITALELSLAKFGASFLLSFSLLVGAFLFAHMATFWDEPAALVSGLARSVRLTASASLLCMAYCALCLFWSAVTTEAAAAVALIYFAVIELAMSLAPAFFRVLSLGEHARQLAALPAQGLLTDYAPSLPPAASVGFLLSGILGYLLGTVIALRTIEYRTQGHP